jgi:hypothetical protein
VGDRAEDAKAAGVRHLDDHIAAVRESKQREFDPKSLAERRFHRFFPWQD